MTCIRQDRHLLAAETMCELHRNEFVIVAPQHATRHLVEDASAHAREILEKPRLHDLSELSERRAFRILVHGKRSGEALKLHRVKLGALRGEDFLEKPAAP